ncbi:MAG: MMPL family transporter [Defluviicoccus sp.]
MRTAAHIGSWRVRGRRWLAGWVAGIARWPRLVVLITLAACVVGVLHTASVLTINTSTLDMLAKDLPFRRNFDALDAAFPQDYRTILVVVESDAPDAAARRAVHIAAALAAGAPHVRSVFYPEADPFFSRNGLLYLGVGELQELVDRLSAAQPMLAALAAEPSLAGLAGVLSLALANVAEAAEAGADAALAMALTSVAATIESVARGRPEPLQWRRLMAGAAASLTDENRQIIVVEPLLDFSALAPAESAVASIRSVVAATAAADDAAAHVRVRLTGELLMLADELTSVRQNIGVVGLVSFALVLVLLIAGLRSLRLFFSVVLTLIAGLILTAWFAAVTIGQLNLISVTFAVLFIGLSVDFGIHYGLRVQELNDRGVGIGLAQREAAAGVGGGLVLSAAVAAVGFLAFLPTAYRGLAELGMIAAAGMAIAAFLNLSLLPALITLMPLDRRVRPRAPGRLAAAIAVLTERHPGRVMAAASVLAVACLAALPRVWFDDSAFALRDPASESVATLLDLLDDRRVDPFRAMVLAPDEASAEALASRLGALPSVREVLTLDDFVPADQADKLAILDQAALLMTAVTASPAPAAPPPPAALRAHLMDLAAAARAAAVEVRAPVSAAAGRLVAAIAGQAWSDTAIAALDRSLVADFPSALADLTQALNAAPFTADDLPAALLERRRTADGRILVEVFAREDQRLQANRRRFAADVQAVAPDASGESIVVTEAGYAVLRSFVQAGALAGAVIFALLITVFRSVRATGVVFSPLLLAAGLTVATGVVIGQPFNFANVIVLPLLFGLGVAGGIHMVLRGQEERAVTLLETSTPRAVLYSALTTIGSFGSLALSSHPGMRSMGVLLTVALIWTTVCTVFVLPPLRLWLLPPSSLATPGGSGPGPSGKDPAAGER